MTQSPITKARLSHCKVIIIVRIIFLHAGGSEGPSRDDWAMPAG
jgi:hypothetical protein